MGFTNAYVAPGCSMVLPAPYDRSAGQGALVGGLFGVAKVDVLSTVDAAFELEGVFVLAKTSAQAWTRGQKIYWDDTNKRCDTDGTVGPLIGVAAEVAANPTSTGTVRLNGTTPNGLEGAQAAIADIAGTLTGTVDGTMVDVAATAAATVGGATPTAGQVDTGIALAVSTIVTGVNTQNKELLTKFNALLAELRIAGIIAP